MFQQKLQPHLRNLGLALVVVCYSTLQSLSQDLTPANSLEKVEITIFSNLKTGQELDSVKVNSVAIIDSLVTTELGDSSAIRSLSKVLAKLKQVEGQRGSLDTLNFHSKELGDSIAHLHNKVVVKGRIVEEKLETLQSQIPSEVGSVHSLPSVVNTPGVPSINVPGVPEIGSSVPSNYAQFPVGLGDVSYPDLPISIENMTDKIQVSRADFPSIKTSEFLDEKLPMELPELTMERLEAIKDIKQNPDKLEEMILELDEAELLRQELEKVEQLKKITDPDFVKEEALNQAKEQAVNHFAGHEEELQAAMEKLSGLKGRYRDAEGALDLFAKKQKPLKGKPLIERFKPSVNLQFQRRTTYWLDISPQIVFQTSRRISFGAGWNERVAYHWDERSWSKGERIWGPRILVQMKLRDKLFLEGIAESMQVRFPEEYGRERDERSRKVSGYFAGLCREFPLGERFQLTSQILYNIYSSGEMKVYTNRLNVRFGVEVRLHKCAKKQSD